MKRILILIVAIALSLPATLQAQIKKGDREWLEQIRTDHPRLFFTTDDLPQIINAAQTYESECFLAMKKRIDKLLGKEIVFKNELARDGDTNNIHGYGYRASESAILWLITRDKRYLDFATEMVRRMAAYYKFRTDRNLNVSWHIFPQIATLCAYDWIYNDLTPADRNEIGQALYSSIYNVAWHGKGIRRSRFRENKSGTWSGGYGVTALPWYIGLTFIHEGINDEECRKMLCNGYDFHQEITVNRAKMIGKDGGCGSGTVSYGLGNYPYAEYDFIYTFRSATGIDITPQMTYMLGYLRYMDWIRLPENKEYGIGDAHHRKCYLPNMAPHIREIANLFGDNNPEIIPYARYLLSLYDNNSQQRTMPFMPLLHKTQIKANHTSVPQTQKSAYFRPLGHIYMRSGLGYNDTYAAFITGRINKTHQHFDINNFIIYKHGYRALDSGTRQGIHLSHYYARTVAHNCITIRMPNEKMPHYWSSPAPNEDRRTPFPNDGGQCNNTDAKLLAYEEMPDWVYIASDATKCYHEAKSELVVREFVWCPSDIFVIFDRVKSDCKEYPKKWLYHTAEEPNLHGKREFSECSQGGKSICRTLLPKDAVIECIGGEGRQFWSDGRNWPIPEPSTGNKKPATPLNIHPMFGQWRVEVSPKKESEMDYFLHIVQVGDESLKSLPKTKCTEENNSVMLSFDYDGRHYSLTFDKRSNHGCKIEVSKGK